MDQRHHDSGSRAPRRTHAARHLFSAPQLRETVALAPQHGLWISTLAGAQAALTTLIALPLVLLSPWSHLVGFAALGALPALFGRFAPPARRGGIVLLCALSQIFAVLVMSLTVWAGVAIVGQILMLAILAGFFYFLGAVGRFGPPGALIFIFAASASMADVRMLDQLFERAAATGSIGLFAVLICVATEWLRRRAGASGEMTIDTVGPRRDIVAAAARIAVGSGAAAFAAHALGAAHPGWAAMGAMAVMQGAHLHIRMNRAIQRTVGTIVGACLVWILLSFTPAPAAIIAILVLLTVATEVIIGFNYALGQMLVTPMALLMTYLAAPGLSGTTLAIERVADTVLGAVIGMIMAIILSTLDDRRHLRRHHVRRRRKSPPPRATKN